jgi:hypothetical protein
VNDLIERLEKAIETINGLQTKTAALIKEFDAQDAALIAMAKAADQHIDAIHKAFGAPGDYGHESPEGKALFALYRFQIELRKAIERAKKMPT